MAHQSRPHSSTEAESPQERMFRHGAVARSAVLLVLSTSMSDADKVEYLRAWCADEALPTTKQDWSSLPAYALS